MLLAGLEWEGVVSYAQTETMLAAESDIEVESQDQGSQSKHGI